MTRTVLAVALLGLGAALAVPAGAQPGPYPVPPNALPAPSPDMAPPGDSGFAPGAEPSARAPQLPALSPEQSANLSQEIARYRQWVDDRVARGEVRPDEAQRLVEWRRWQLARQIAGLSQPEPRVIERRYVYQPAPYYAPGPYYYGPRVSICAGGAGRHTFGSVCF